MITNEITSLAQEDKHALAEHRFIEDTIHKAGSACNKINNKNFDIDKAKNQIENDFVALKVDGGLQALVVAQMMAIHKLQQTSMALANGLPYGDSSKFYTNTSIKLSNTFIQQATLLAKLQGGIGQKIVVEHVDVHQGGQAIGGNIQGGLGRKEKI